MLKVYRLQKQKYASLSDTLSGEGAMRTGGRWNKRGTPLVYTASTPELAVLETLVHLEGTPLSDLPPLVITTLCIPEESITELIVKELPEHWNDIPPSLATQKITEPWLSQKLSLTLKVPSVIIPLSNNYLLNPLHQLISQVQLLDSVPFDFDKRLHA